MTIPAPKTTDGLEVLRQLIVAPEIQRLEERLNGDTARMTALVQDVERRTNERLDSAVEKLAEQHSEIVRAMQAESTRLTQAMEQVSAQFGRRVESLIAESRTRLDDVTRRLADQERSKLNAADFGATLATLGQRFATGMVPSQKGAFEGFSAD
jgi:dsDNA-specific endonuclease/ATPase MutS2